MCWNPSTALLPFSVSLPLPVSLFLRQRRVWLLLFPLLSISPYPSLGMPYPKLLPLSSSLLPEASSQNEKCGLVRPLKATLGLSILFPSLARGGRVP